ncbi:MAG: hypothetical protein LJE92_12260 [Gammaproteobacteria bacterium]|nr:hypothetical protein [Gammaproteobacteria bacterium]
MTIEQQYNNKQIWTLGNTEDLSHGELQAEVKRLWHREAFFDASQRLAQFGYCE